MPVQMGLTKHPHPDVSQAKLFIHFLLCHSQKMPADKQNIILTGSGAAKLLTNYTLGC